MRYLMGVLERAGVRWVRWWGLYELNIPISIHRCSDIDIDISMGWWRRFQV